jgi:hypothetical protein
MEEKSQDSKKTFFSRIFVHPGKKRPVLDCFHDSSRTVYGSWLTNLIVLKVIRLAKDTLNFDNVSAYFI